MKKILFATAILVMGAIFLNMGCQLQKGAKNMVLLPVKDDPTLSFRILFKAGSQDDPAGKEGLAALTASLITQGSTQKHAYEEILDLLYPMAASINSQVDKEMTVIYGRIHKDNLNDYYALFKEVLFEPAFKQEDFDRVRDQLVNYVSKSLRYADDEELGKEVLNEYIFAGTPYGHLEEGHINSLKNITLNDVKEFYKSHFTQENVIIGIGGGYESGFPGQVETDFKALPVAPVQPVALPAVQPFEGLHVKIVEKNANATAISFGYPIDVLRGSKDFYALALATSWLGEHRNSSSHLYQVIREKRGLNYGDYAYIEHFPNGGRRQFPPPNVARHQQIFQIWIRPVPNYARLFAFRAAMRELQKLVDNGMSQEDFDLTRQFLKNYIAHYAPTTMLKLGYALDDAFYGIKEGHWNLYRKMLDKLTLNDVNTAIKTHLQYKNIKAVFVTNEADKLKEALLSNAPSPIEYPTPKSADILEEDKEIASYPLKVKAEDVEIVPIEDVFVD